MANLNKLFSEQLNKSLHLDNGGEIKISFCSNETKVVSFIESSEVIVGCAPWFNNQNIINALQNVNKGCCIILDKKQFMKLPDYEARRYISNPVNFCISTVLKNGCIKAFFKRDLDSVNNDSTFRLFGVNGDNYSLMHYKYLIRCDIEKNEHNEVNLKPKAVITGSLNYTYNMNNSRELFLEIDSEEFAISFYEEWCELFSLSESILSKNNELTPEFLQSGVKFEDIEDANEICPYKDLIDMHENIVFSEWCRLEKEIYRQSDYRD
ncbi:hypothetical protein [Thiomicrorhabdus sediminis]|uniref:PLD-like domain-containing protein n=1 Tax=Thiomicrorhabdus sediminis TaxID=2580412 RepID=A0A4P9K662_9GAMM|nr:hypothetical protein [Thiomicrorhabdus sediminis]QCU89786.1 hypothetical protein FE785_03600 [Thiomicrorhabdus sediminis]